MVTAKSEELWKCFEGYDVKHSSQTICILKKDVEWGLDCISQLRRSKNFFPEPNSSRLYFFWPCPSIISSHVIHSGSHQKSMEILLTLWTFMDFYPLWDLIVWHISICRLPSLRGYVRFASPGKSEGGWGSPLLHLPPMRQRCPESRGSSTLWGCSDGAHKLGKASGAVAAPSVQH